RSRRSSSARNTGSAHAARNSASSCWHAGTSVSGTNSPPNSPKRPSGPGSPITGAVVVSLMVGSRSGGGRPAGRRGRVGRSQPLVEHPVEGAVVGVAPGRARWRLGGDRKSTRLNSSHVKISYAVFCLKKKTEIIHKPRVL